MFVLLCGHRDDGVFDDFSKISHHFPKFSEDSEHFPKISEDFRRFSNIAEDFQGRSEDVSIIHHSAV